jgi:RNA polymerase sigma-70 factor (ECF subfamily)
LKEKELNIFEQLRKDPDEVLVKLYGQYRKEFLSWAYKTYAVLEEDSTDCFQDAMIIFYRNIKSGKLNHLNSSIKTYLFSIGKNLLFRKFKDKSRHLPLTDSIYRETDSDNFEFPELYSGNSIENVIAAMVSKLKDPCKSILKYFYYRGFSMDEIAEEMNYKNAQTVKAQKVRCIKELQGLIQVKMKMK